MVRRSGVVRKMEDAYISRFMGKGWRVNVIQAGIDHGQHYCYDHQHAGDPEASLRAARALRDAVLRINGLKPVIFDGNGFHRKNKANRFGVPGVSLGRIIDDHGNPRSVSWLARWTREGIHCSKGFSILKYGYEGAWSKALALRLEMTKQPPLERRAPEPEPWLKDWMLLRGLDYWKS